LTLTLLTMDHAKQLNELLVLVNRAKRGGLIVHHYPEAHLAIFRVPPAPPEKPLAASDTPPAIPPVPAPPAQ